MQDRLDRFGIAVRKAREERKLSQQELAQKLSMNKNTIMDIELGRSNPKAETLFLIATELHISLDTILFSEKDLPNAVCPEVLAFFASKTTDGSRRFINVCHQLETFYYGNTSR